MELSPDERLAIADLARDLRGRFAATEVRLFGSAATGTLEAESDIDVFVVVPALTWPTEQAICDRCYEATLACGRLVTPSVFSVGELTDTPLRASPFVRSVKREGVLL